MGRFQAFSGGSGEATRLGAGLVAAGILLCAALFWASLLWPPPAGPPAHLPAEFSSLAAQPWAHPLVDGLKLAVAAMIGMLITAVHKRYHQDRPMTRSMEQAQVLLCVSGALMMIIIGNSLPRALGIAGGASIVRFRTPVEDPKDSTILFLLLGLGMSCGLGAFGVTGLGTLFLCVFLAVLSRIGERKPRLMMLELVGEGPEFPTAHVNRILGGTAEFFEPREFTHGQEPVFRYHVVLNANVSLTYLSQQLMGGGAAGIKSVSWEPAKKSETT